MANEVLIVIGLLLTVGWVIAVRLQRRVQRLKDAGVFPQPGEETEADVDRLLHLGLKIEAIKVFRTVHEVGLREAKDAVKKRQREIGLS